MLMYVSQDEKKAMQFAEQFEEAYAKVEYDELLECWTVRVF